MWFWQKEPDSDVSNVDGALRMDVRKSGPEQWKPQLFICNINIERGKRYRVEYEMRYDPTGTLLIRLGSSVKPGPDFGFVA